MPHSITGILQYGNVATVPSDGDPAVAASVEVSIQRLLNNTSFLQFNLSHQMMDDRGKASTLTGSIVVNNGGGDIDFEVPMRFGANIDVYADFTIHSGHELVNAGSSDLRGDVTLGSNETTSLQVNSLSQFSNAVRIRADATISDGTLNVSSPANFTAAVDMASDVTLGHDVNDAISIGGVLTAQQGAHFLEDVRVDGSTRLGTSSADTHEINGGAQFNNGVSVEGAFESNSSTNVRDLNASGEATFNGDVVMRQDVTIGESSADHVTFNALVDSPIGFVEAGKVLERIATAVNGTASYTTLDGNYLFVGAAGTNLTGNCTWTFDATNLSKGDHWTISNLSPFTINVQALGSTLLVQPQEWIELKCLVNGGGWVLFRYGTSS